MHKHQKLSIFNFKLTDIDEESSMQDRFCLLWFILNCFLTYECVMYLNFYLFACRENNCNRKSSKDPWLSFKKNCLIWRIKLECDTSYAFSAQQIFCLLVEIPKNWSMNLATYTCILQIYCFCSPGLSCDKVLCYVYIFLFNNSSLF